MAKQKVGVDPAVCRHGLWPSSPVVDGAILALLKTYFQVLEELGARIAQAEEAAVRGRNVAKLNGVYGTGNGVSPVEGRLGTDGQITEQEVRELRDMRNVWIRQLRTLVHKAEADLGRRAPIRGPRDEQGRLRIISS